MKKKKKQKLNKSHAKIYFGICIFLLGLFFLIFANIEKTGILGDFTNNFLKGIFGRVGKLIPIFLFVISAVFLFASLRKKMRKFLIPIFLFFVISLLFFDILDVSSGSFKEHFSDGIKMASDYKGGGMLGVILSHPIRGFLGDTGSYIVITMLLIYTFFLIFNVEKKDIVISTQKAVDHIENKISTNYERIKTKRAIRNPYIDGDKSVESEDNYITFHNESNEEESKKDRVKVTEIPLSELKDEDEELVVKKNSYKINSYSDEDIPSVTEIARIKKDDRDSFDTSNNDFLDKKENNNVIDSSKMDNEEREYVLPSINLLNKVPKRNSFDKRELEEKAKTIESTLQSFGIDATVESINRGPTITCYEIKPAIGVRVSKITNLHDDLSMALQTKDIRILAPIPGKSRVGIEAPNTVKDFLFLREIIDSPEFKESKSVLPMALGKDISGKIIVSSISDMPHLLIAGATGSGKSVCINSLILSILYKASPNDVKMILIDPKVVELSVYNGIPHLLIPVVTDAKKAAMALDWAVTEMDRRYALFAKNSARDFKSYNDKIKDNPNEEKLKKLVIVIDELADLMLVSGQEVEDSICRLAQMARAAGIYLIVATQRPSVDVITGTIKANIPSRISFAVSSQIDSRTILDIGGAEKLLGKGDMLFLPQSQNSPTRIQGAFVSDKEVEAIVNFLKEQNESHDYDEEVIDQVDAKVNMANAEDVDELLKDAILLVVKDNQGSISYLQRKLKVGYSRAARMIDQMEEIGVVGPNEGSKPRKVLISLDEIDSVVANINNE